MNLRSKEYLGTGILEGYGLTECSPVVAVGHSADDSRLGTVGQFFETYQVQIRDRDGRILDINDEGVLWVKGPSVVSGYFRDEVNTRERFVDGWFNTGDVVRVDRDGYVQIVDRATDIIIVSGFNVYPQEVENALCKHPAVSSIALLMIRTIWFSGISVSISRGSIPCFWLYSLKTTLLCTRSPAFRDKSSTSLAF